MITYQEAMAIQNSFPLRFIIKELTFAYLLQTHSVIPVYIRRYNVYGTRVQLIRAIDNNDSSAKERKTDRNMR